MTTTYCWRARSTIRDTRGVWRRPRRIQSTSTVSPQNAVPVYPFGMEISLPSGIITNPRPCRVIWMVPTGRSFCGTSAKMNLPRPSDSNRPSRPISSRTFMILRRVSWFKTPNVLATCLWLRGLLGWRLKTSRISLRS